MSPTRPVSTAMNRTPPSIPKAAADMPKFTPDSSVVFEVVPSENFGERNKGLTPDMILLHYTGMPDLEGALYRLCTAGTDVSAHYVVLEDGRILQCVPEDKRAWHAGVSYWAGETDINSCSIGIEIVNPGHEFGYADFPLRQTAAVISLCKAIITRRGPISPDRVLAHSDVAPSRKQDPGEKFPWELLSDSGIGHWVRPAPANMDGVKLHPGDRSDGVARLQRMLAHLGVQVVSLVTAGLGHGQQLVDLILLSSAEVDRATIVHGLSSVASDVPTWGGMIAQGRQMLHQGWWVLAVPLAALFLTVLAFNWLGEGLRRALDPVMRR